jgi:SIR2-like domain
LCLGSGVSQASGIPDWRELLRRLSQRAWPGRSSDFHEAFLESGFSLPAIASILEGRLGDDFLGAVRAELYRKFPAFNKEREPGPVRRVRELLDQNTTLRAVAALCVRKVGKTYVRNENVRAIVNLNFDVLLRTYMAVRYRPHLLRTVERADAPIARQKIPTYHAHGLIHFDPKYFGDRERESPDLMVFTERQYFDFFGRAFAVFSYTMMALLREHSFLFIGTALRDDNLRRLLHYSYQERVAAAERRDRVQQPRRWLRHFLLTCRSGDRNLDHTTQLAHERIGVRTIWLDTWSELPAFLGDLYKKDRSTWSQVYDPK